MTLYICEKGKIMRILKWASQPEQMFKPDAQGTVSFDLYSNAALAVRRGTTSSIPQGHLTSNAETSNMELRLPCSYHFRPEVDEKSQFKH